jgi:hypothetical protein
MVTKQYMFQKIEFFDIRNLDNTQMSCKGKWVGNETEIRNFKK